jgi:3-oxoadipate enol-lactonase
VLANTSAQIPSPGAWNSRIRSARESGRDVVALTTAERWFTKTSRETHPENVETVMEMVRTTSLHGYLATCAAMRDMDQREAIRSIGNKVFVIAGRHDPSTPPARALGREFHRRRQIHHTGSIAHFRTLRR